MTSPMSVFLIEGNVEIYLSRLHTTWNPEERDKLLRLLVREEAQMGFGREHLENAQRRVSDGRDRIARQRRLVDNLPLPRTGGCSGHIASGDPGKNPAAS